MQQKTSQIALMKDDVIFCKETQKCKHIFENCMVFKDKIPYYHILYLTKDKSFPTPISFGQNKWLFTIPNCLKTYKTQGKNFKHQLLIHDDLII